jgi:hypothetical protein
MITIGFVVLFWVAYPGNFDWRLFVYPGNFDWRLFVLGWLSAICDVMVAHLLRAVRERKR